jgi:hypothetical protein
MSIDRATQLKELKLFGMSTAWGELIAEGPRQPVQPEAWLDRLINAEQADGNPPGN